MQLCAVYIYQHQINHKEVKLKSVKIYAIANQKGGVGKTTTAVNLAAGLADLGYFCLLIDLDPQANATLGLGFDPTELEAPVYRVITGDLSINQATVKTQIERLYLLPSGSDLVGAEIELVEHSDRTFKLKQALESEPLPFDFIFIDCAPSLGIVTLNALTAADYVLVPVQCEFYSLSGLVRLFDTIKLVQENYNPQLAISGILLTMYDPRTRLGRDVIEEVRTKSPAYVFKTIIPRSIRLAEAPSFGVPITIFDPNGVGANAYRNLAEEVVAIE